MIRVYLALCLLLLVGLSFLYLIPDRLMRAIGGLLCGVALIGLHAHYTSEKS